MKSDVMEGESRRVSRRTLFYMMCTTAALILFLLYEVDRSSHVGCVGCIPSEKSPPRDPLQGTAGDQVIEGCYVHSKGRLGRSRTEVDFTMQRDLDCAKRRAKVVVLGVKKCGTETLTASLDLHPDIVTHIYTVEDDTGMDLQSSTFTQMTPLSTPNEIVVLNMIGLQYSPEKISRVLEFLGEDVKFILMVKDPVQRALSDYSHVNAKMRLPKGKKMTKIEKEHVWNFKTMEVKGSKEKVKYFKSYRIADSFEKSVFNTSGLIDGSFKLISLGLYDEYVQSILDQIPEPGNLLVLDGETFVKRPWFTLREVEGFLEVSSFFRRKLYKKEGQYFCPKVSIRPDAGCLHGKGRDKPNVAKKVITKLTKFYEPHNQQLLNLTGVEFTWIANSENESN